MAIGASTAAISACVGDDPATGSTTGSDAGSGDGSNGSDAISTTDGNTGNETGAPDAGPSVVDVSFGFSSACALLSDGTVWCWGDDGEGSLGVSAVSLPAGESCGACRPTPAAVPGLSNIKQISAGQGNCAVDGVGDVYCWGANDIGQLGHPPNTNGDGNCPGGGTGICNITPTKVAGLADVTKVVAGGTGTACALTTAHTIYCWGGNGTLLLGETDAAVTTSTPTLIPGLAGKTITDFDIPLNAPQGCAVSQNDGVYCWGFNNSAQCGHNPNTDGDESLGSGLFSGAATPMVVIPSTLITPNIDGTDVTQVAAVQGATCGSTADGGVKCWGDNKVGEFANGGFTLGGLSYSSILRSNIAASITSITGRGGSSEGSFCGLTPDAHVMCWGSTNFGQLGNGVDSLADASVSADAGPICAPGIHCAATAQQIGTSMTMKKISAGWNGAVALGTDGKVYAWGQNSSGQLGHEPLTNGDDGACADPGIVGGLACNPKPSIVNGLP